MQTEEITNQNKEVNPSTENKRIPPIIVTGIKIDHKIIRVCFKGFLKSPFQIKYVNKKVNVYTNTKEDY